MCINASQWAFKKTHLETKRLLRQKRPNQTVCMGGGGKKIIPSRCWKRGIILGCQAAKAYLINDFIRAKQNKEMSVGSKPMTQMFYPDLSSDSEHPLHLRDSTWPLVIWRRCTHAEHRKRQTAASPLVARHWVISSQISNNIKRSVGKPDKSSRG